MKTILGIHGNPRSHMVGDGFPVRSLFSYSSHGEAVSPFLLLDFAGPANFAPAERPRGVGVHPHRGFETVTIVYEGEVAHRDSTGQGGLIGPGDVQWMTAAGGILHEEFHSPAFTRRGGLLQMIQLWVNLPAKDKMSAPGYQTLLADSIPSVALPDGAGTLRVIAGAYGDHAGPARTFTPVNAWDVQLAEGSTATLDLPAGHTTMLVVVRGAIRVEDKEVGEAKMVSLSREGTGAVVSSQAGARVLVLTGEPIDEPIVGYGPFVMNTEAEIRQAVDDFNRGRFGAMAR